MSPFHLPWVLVFPLLCFFLLLALREFLHARILPTVAPERGIGFFHAFILVILAILLLIGTWSLYAHVLVLSEKIALYPHARYAPEREAFADEGEWVFVTNDDTATVVTAYRARMEDLGYAVIESKDASRVKRLLFTRGETTLFLTIEDEGSIRVLYYSEDGEMRTVPVP